MEKRRFETVPNEPGLVAEAVLVDDEVTETITHDAPKPGPGLEYLPEFQKPQPIQQERVVWPAVAAYAALLISILHGLFDAVR